MTGYYTVFNEGNNVYLEGIMDNVGQSYDL